MTDQGGVSGTVLGVRDQLASLVLTPSATSSRFALIDILLVAVILYYGYLLIRETRAMRILFGLAMLGVVYVLAQLLQLVTLLFLLRSIFAVVLVAIPVVFQPELRAALERLGRTRFMSAQPLASGSELHDLVHALTQALVVLAGSRTGALVVVEQHDSLREYVASGIRIGGQLTPELLITIFRTGSPLHDGAVVLRGTRVEAASVLLPVAGDRFDSSIGTRHRAAVGISQETDGIALVVSEETGRISLAHQGKLQRNIAKSQLEPVLMRTLRPPQSRTLHSIARRFGLTGSHRAR